MGARAPSVGEWYTDRENGQLFEIVAFDEQAMTIEIQYVDGEVGEYDFEQWVSLNLSSAAAPEDWSASYELAQEDINHNALSLDLADDPLVTLEPESMLGYDEYY